MSDEQREHKVFSGSTTQVTRLGAYDPSKPGTYWAQQVAVPAVLERRQCALQETLTVLEQRLNAEEPGGDQVDLANARALIEAMRQRTRSMRQALAASVV